MNRYPSIPHVDDPEAEGLLSGDHEIVVTEKIDGASFRFKRTPNGALLFGKRGGIFGDQNGQPKPTEECGERFQPTMEYLYEAVDFDALDNLYEQHGELWFYGESLYEHSIDYDAWEGAAPEPHGDVPNFVGFDVYSVKGDSFVPYDTMREIFGALCLTTAPLVLRTTATQLRKEGITVPSSMYRTANPSADTEFDRDGLAEGVVLRNTATNCKAKYVHDAFSERNAIAFNDVAYAQSLSGAYVAAYITDARIRKHVHKLLDEGKYSGVSMEMLELLPDRVVDDAISEEGREIDSDAFEGHVEGDIEALVRKKAGRKCEQVVREVIDERQR